MSTQTWLAAAGMGLVLSMAGAPVQAQTEPQRLTVASWGGAYARSQILAFVDPFRKQTGSWVELVDFGGDLDRVREQVAAGDVTFDVVDLEGPDLIRGCEEGLLRPLDGVPLLPGADGSAAADDYYPGLLRPCGIGSVISATLLVYREDALGEAGARLASAADLFDLDRFPGSRALRRTPRVNLEWALLADGVPADQLYAVLETEAGVDRALAKLDTIRDSIVWWDGGEEPFELLASYRVAIASAFNGRVFARRSIWNEPVQPVWSTAVWTLNFWAMPVGAPHPAAGEAFLTFASSPERQALQANEIAYGPPRRSAVELVASAVQPLLPTAPTHADRSLQSDDAWWARNGRRIEERFERWLRGEARLGIGARTRGRDVY
jgi:putative spermidine/putrescine transport system substrate-binding protein